MTAQIDDHGRLRHLLSLDGLPRPILEDLLARAQALGVPERSMLDAYASLPATQRKLVRDLVASLARAYEITG